MKETITPEQRGFENMPKEKSQDNLSYWELVQQEACSPGFCGTIWIEKLIKGEITWDDIPKARRQPKGSQESFGEK